MSTAETREILVFHPYTMRFLMLVSQLEVTVSASPVGPSSAERPANVTLQFRHHGEDAQLEIETDAEELEGLGHALVSCARSIRMTPDEALDYMRRGQNTRRENEG